MTDPLPRKFHTGKKSFFLNLFEVSYIYLKNFEFILIFFYHSNFPMSKHGMIYDFYFPEANTKDRTAI